jgi:hypothetical protein
MIEAGVAMDLKPEVGDWPMNSVAVSSNHARTPGDGCWLDAQGIPAFGQG